MAGFTAHGATLKMWDGAAFTKIPEIGDVKLDRPKKNQIDVTSHDSTDEEYIQGLGANGTVTTSIWYDPAQPMHELLLTKHDESQPTNFQLVTQSGKTRAFAATVNVSESYPVKGAEKVDVTLNISGSVT